MKTGCFKGKTFPFEYQKDQMMIHMSNLAIIISVMISMAMHSNGLIRLICPIFLKIHLLITVVMDVTCTARCIE